MEQSMEVQSELCKETKSQEVEDPDAERILEDDDWITNGANFNVDDDDLMDEDELLTEESHQGTKVCDLETERMLTPIVDENGGLKG